MEDERTFVISAWSGCGYIPWSQSDQSLKTAERASGRWAASAPPPAQPLGAAVCHSPPAAGQHHLSQEARCILQNDSALGSAVATSGEAAPASAPLGEAQEEDAISDEKRGPCWDRAGR